MAAPAYKSSPHMGDHTMETIYSFATPVRIKRQLVTLDGQIRYQLILDDIPLESPDFCALRKAIDGEVRLEITLKGV